MSQQVWKHCDPTWLFGVPIAGVIYLQRYAGHDCGMMTRSRWVLVTISDAEWDAIVTLAKRWGPCYVVD